MKGVVLGMLLVCLILAGTAGLIGSAQPPSALPHGSDTGFFEMDALAVRPPDDIEGFLVIKNREDPVHVKGSVIVFEETTAGMSEEWRELLEVDEELAPFSELRAPLTVPVEGVGTVHLRFRPDSNSDHVVVGAVVLAGLSPVEVEVQEPVSATPLVSVPGRPVEFAVTITAMADSDLTELRMRAPHVPGEIEIGDLDAGEGFTGTFTVSAEEAGRYQGVDRVSIEPDLYGVQEGIAFDHPLFLTDKDELERLRATVYIAPQSAAFVIPPADARLATTSPLELVLLNAEDKTKRIRGHVELQMPGLPHLGARFPFDERVDGGMVENLLLDWTPPAAGVWMLEVRHNLNLHEERVEPFRVAGPIEQVDFQRPSQEVERDRRVVVPVVVETSEDIDLEGLAITTVDAPLKGTISVDDLFLVEPVEDVRLEAGVPVTVPLALTPKATGPHDLYVVVDTSEGLSVHSVDRLTVTGTRGGWPLAWSPTLAVGALLGVHWLWRRNWVA